MRTDYSTFIKLLRKRLQEPLPGVEAQYKMAPEGRMPPELHDRYLENARKGGVLLLLYPRMEVPHFVLTLRQEYPGVHSGQVSFPGGRMEEHDKDLVETAIRETEEEIGINRKKIDVIGKLSRLYIPPSNFLVQPVVARLTGQPEFVAEEGEVAKIIETSLEELLHENTAGTSEITVANRYTLTAPVFEIQGHTVWGATAMMLSEFIHVIEEMDLG